MTNPPSIPLAEARVAAARDRLGDTLSELQTRLDPRTVAQSAIDEITESGEKALRTGADAVRRNPAKVAGAVALLGAILGRHRIGALIARLRADPDKGPQPAPARRVRFPRPRRAPAKRKSS